MKRMRGELRGCVVCGLPCPEKTMPAAKGWDWFTGYLPITVNFCPRHKGNELRDRLFGISNTRTEAWSDKEKQYVEALLVKFFERKQGGGDGQDT